MGRKPAVANAFYHSSPARLNMQISGMVEKEVVKEKAIGIVSPHAGFMYSGSVAGAVYSRIELPRTIVLLGPNHTGYGANASIMMRGSWDMPLGAVEINSAMAKKLLELTSSFQEDESAHAVEHSLEVQLPFIQYFTKDFKIVPVVLMRRPLKQCEELGLALAQAIKESQEETLIVASTDMSHYEPHKIAEHKDKLAIERILALDYKGLYETVTQQAISMCGFIPATVMLVACKELGAKKARLVKYETSARTSGDYSSVVGYAGIIVN